MKYCLSIYIVLLSMVCMAQSEDPNVTQGERTFNQHQTKGIKVALLKSLFDLEFENSGLEFKDEYNAKQRYGFLIGYQDIPAYDVGFNVQAAYNMYDEKEAIRLEANIAYGINEMVHVLGGLNMNQYLGGDMGDLSSDIGYQLGAGANIQNFNVSLMYYHIQNSTDDFNVLFDDFETKVRLTGLELAVGMTF